MYRWVGRWLGNGPIASTSNSTTSTLPSSTRWPSGPTSNRGPSLVRCCRRRLTRPIRTPRPSPRSLNRSRAPGTLSGGSGARTGWPFPAPLRAVIGGGERHRRGAGAAGPGRSHPFAQPPDLDPRPRSSIDRATRTFPLLGPAPKGRWDGFRTVLGPWPWTLIVYVCDQEADLVIVVTVQDTRSGRSPRGSLALRAVD